ncbi:hypothetical protein [Thermococcus sp. JCM 11816]|uniref:hypothetical protein n=1 Tax=Thermococcus sp. (strain JCM 11816 / KS-1) TaxID=1295125 RepID=UPI0034659578
MEAVTGTLSHQRRSPQNAYILIRSNSSSHITENNGPPAKAYTAGDQGEFPIVAAQIIELEDKKPSVIIISGESPIGSYEPMWNSLYYQKPLDGPTAIANILHWALNLTKTKAQTLISTSSGSDMTTTHLFITLQQQRIPQRLPKHQLQEHLRSLHLPPVNSALSKTLSKLPYAFGGHSLS